MQALFCRLLLLLLLRLGDGHEKLRVWASVDEQRRCWLFRAPAPVQACQQLSHWSAASLYDLGGQASTPLPSQQQQPTLNSGGSSASEYRRSEK